MMKYDFQDSGLTELTKDQLHEISGGGEIAKRIGYACGWVVGCVTNAVEMTSKLMYDAMSGKLLDKAWHQ
ncbi:hypothetical protein [Fibrella aquatica]|uniref:hypothetical protein n=1 Tax=Fibrella aquatica TaxID=3242487 RepID=UPI003520CDE2